MSTRELSVLEERLGYKFKNIKFLETGVTHSSFSNETKNHVPYNERQEFLGDAVLSIIVSDYIFENYTKLPEGELTKLRASLVCEKSLCGFANEIELGSFLRLGHGEELMGGRERPSILADAFEAVLAAIYLDGGIEPATEFVLSFVKKALEHVENAAFKDYKTLLQEIIQKNPEERLTYMLVGESGPDHDKRFEVDVLLNSNVIGHGIGKSKKAAEQHAAKEALELMGQ
ncbi:MAG: ribonuclease III [Ruminococcaceae bacterium]|nr:ribonuclease III [Oscillospiraceae bacterium]